MELVFIVTPCAETGGFVARWDAPVGGGICTQGDSFAELQNMVTDAVRGYFDGETLPDRLRLHFTQDPILAVA
jgi:predicted RNase H-like HicB family nuclease